MARKEDESGQSLFMGKPDFLGGLSNERELAKMCPEGFKNTNEWSEYAMKLFYEGGSVSGWEWKTEDEQEQRRQIGCFKGLLGSFDIKHEDKEAVAGWMLSEMIKTVPEHGQGKKQT